MCGLGSGGGIVIIVICVCGIISVGIICRWCGEGLFVLGVFGLFVMMVMCL